MSVLDPRTRALAKLHFLTWCLSLALLCLLTLGGSPATSGREGSPPSFKQRTFPSKKSFLNFFLLTYWRNRIYQKKPKQETDFFCLLGKDLSTVNSQIWKKLKQYNPDLVNNLFSNSGLFTKSTVSNNRTASKTNGKLDFIFPKKDNLMLLKWW